MQKKKTPVVMGNARFTVYTDGCVRLEYSYGGKFAKGPSLLVGHRTTVHGFVIDDELEADRYSLRLQTTGTGKFCLSPPGTREAYCVESADRRHVSSMYVREAIQKAVAEYNIMQARVVPDADARWGDIVRTIDGARTCCGARQFRVAIARP